MATATDSFSPPPFSRSSSLSINRSPDTASPLYPERAIRPLPKSRLKAKLSPEQVSSIAFPPEPAPLSPTLNMITEAERHVAAAQDARFTNGVRNGPPRNGSYSHHPPANYHHQQHDHCTCGEDGDSGDDEVEFDHPDYRYATPSGAAAAGGKMMDNVQRRLMEAARIPSKPPPPGSTASSADGYESFENTSNKKKRKIPLSTTSSMHQSQLSAEMASMGISNVDGAVDDVHGGEALAVQQQQYAPAPAASSSNAAGTGISGAGRGRYGRGKRYEEVRRPLASSSMNAANGYSGRMPGRSGSDGKNPVDSGIENTGGIISQAIKSAAEQGPLTPQSGQENSSLLQSATAPAATKTQFTFAVDSETSGVMRDQQAAVAAAQAQAAYAAPVPNTRGVNGQAAHAKGVNTQGTQTTPPLRGNPPPPAGTNARQPPNPPNQPPQQAGQAPPPPKPKPRRRPSKEFALAARQRRLQQEYTNYHHRPNKDTMWICEFCEYEDIFGVPPVALIRQYEIKDRQDRKRQAEKRRLLEKAKAKGRKGKKGGKKGNAANNAVAPPAQPQAPYDPNRPEPLGDEEYYDDDEYADEYDPVGPDDQYGAEYYPPPMPEMPVDAVPGSGEGGKLSAG